MIYFLTQELVTLQEKICQSPVLRQYVVSFNIDEYNNVHLYFDRKTYMKDVFEMVFTNGIAYGQRKNPTAASEHFLVNGGNVLADSSSEDAITVGWLRTLLLCNHMSELLKQNRYCIGHCMTSC